jgi:hypothetical protein
MLDILTTRLAIRLSAGLATLPLFKHCLRTIKNEGNVYNVLFCAQINFLQNCTTNKYTLEKRTQDREACPVVGLRTNDEKKFVVAG